MDAQQNLRGLRGEDIEVIKRLFDSLFTPLRFLAERITRNESEAEDIALNSLAKLWEKGLSEFESEVHLNNYAKKLVENAALDYLRKQKSKKNYQDFLIHTEERSEEFLAERSRYETEIINVIYKEVESLPNQMKEVFKLVYFHKMSGAEVAAKLNISTSTVYVYCSNAIKELRQILSVKKLLFLLFFLNLNQDN